MSLTVAQVYNKIAKEFDKTRVSIWNNVKNFLDSIPVGNSVLDIGCGNGKNMLYRKDLLFQGIDISEKQVEICKQKGLDVTVSSMCKLPYRDNSFENIICVASYHHLDNDDDRCKALQEMYRCLATGGRALITVWAIGKDGKKVFTKRDELVEWKSKDGNIYHRYYHMYDKGDLEEEISRLEPRFKHVDVGFEANNWWIVLSKTSEL
jgi:ubiquinone/menaquinone biosynthesis C-methylase UbiE